MCTLVGATAPRAQPGACPAGPSCTRAVDNPAYLCGDIPPATPGRVTYSDLMQLHAHMGAAVGHPNYLDCADLNQDCHIDAVDIAIMDQRFAVANGCTASPPPCGPLPSAVGSVELYLDAAHTQPVTVPFNVGVGIGYIYVFARVQDLAGLKGLATGPLRQTPPGNQVPLSWDSGFAPFDYSSWGFVLANACQTPDVDGFVLLGRLRYLALAPTMFTELRFDPLSGEQAQDECMPLPLLLACDEPYFTAYRAAIAVGTAAGTDITVTPETGVEITFDEVTAAGHTTATEVPCGSPPVDFVLEGACYEITTTATFSGDVEICIGYDDTGIADESVLTLLHCSGGTCSPIPSTVDAVNNIVCGVTTGFSSFAVASPDPATDHHGPMRPGAYRLYPSRPNPFNPSTAIAFDLPERASVRLEVFDVAGRLVRVLVDGRDLDAGRHEATWNGRDAAGRPVGSGVFFYRLSAGDIVRTQRTTLIE